MLSMAILVSFVRWSLWNSRAPSRSWADSLWNEGRGCEAARSRQKQLVSQGVPRWRLLPPKWCRCVPGPPGANPHCRMTLLSPGFIDTVSSSDLTVWLSALLMLRCEGAVRGEGRWTLGPPVTGDHHCRDLHSSLLLTWVVVSPYLLFRKTSRKWLSFELFPIVIIWELIIGFCTITWLVPAFPRPSCCWPLPCH